MTREEVYAESHKVIHSAAVNMRYHQCISSYYLRADRGLKILTGILAVVGAIAAFQPEPSTWGIVVAVSAAILAVVLNVMPFGEWGMKHKELFARWNELLESADLFSKKIPASVAKATMTDLEDLQSRCHKLNSCEDAPIQFVLDRQIKAENAQRKAENDYSTQHQTAEANVAS